MVNKLVIIIWLRDVVWVLLVLFNDYHVLVHIESVNTDIHKGREGLNSTKNLAQGKKNFLLPFLHVSTSTMLLGVFLNIGKTEK